MVTRAHRTFSQNYYLIISATHNEIKSFYDQSRIARKKIKVWFKQKDRKKDDNFSNDWTETGAWKDPRLNNGWAGGAAEIALEQTLEIAPNMHSRNPTSCFVRRTSKGTRVTFASNIHQIKEICSSLPLPLMSPDERRSKNELLSIYEKKKLILKIYYMADKIINASRAMEELRSMDVLKLRIPYVSDLVIEKKAKYHHSVSILFLTMSSDDGKMGNATPSVPLSTNSSWHNNDLKEYSFQLRHGHVKNKSIKVHLFKGSVNSYIKLGCCNINCEDLPSSSSKSWTRETIELQNFASNITSGKIVLEKRKSLRVIEIRQCKM